MKRTPRFLSGGHDAQEADNFCLSKPSLIFMFSEVKFHMKPPKFMEQNRMKVVLKNLPWDTRARGGLKSGMVVRNLVQ